MLSKLDTSIVVAMRTVVTSPSLDTDAASNQLFATQCNIDRPWHQIPADDAGETLSQRPDQ